MTLEFRTHHGLDPTAAAHLGALLGHKGAPYTNHLADYIAAGAPPVHDGLHWQFHVAWADGQPVANICVWQAGNGGILGHVYTDPAHRGRGLASQLLAIATRPHREDPSRWLHLNAEPGSGAQRLYAAAGFRPVDQVPGAMILGRAPAPPIGPLRIDSFRWAHWPALNAFLLHQPLLRLQDGSLGPADNLSAESLVLEHLYLRAGRLLVAHDTHGAIGGLALADPRHPPHAIVAASFADFARPLIAACVQ